jgi:hypothetical protein
MWCLCPKVAPTILVIYNLFATGVNVEVEAVATTSKVLIL